MTTELMGLAKKATKQNDTTEFDAWTVLYINQISNNIVQNILRTVTALFMCPSVGTKAFFLRIDTGSHLFITKI